MIDRSTRVAPVTGFGTRRPVPAGPLSDIGDLPCGTVLAQKGNSCGICSLSAVMRHWGVETTQEQLDRRIRNLNIFGAPDLIINTARENGFEAAFFNRGSLSAIFEMVDRGVPVLLIVDVYPGDWSHPVHLHYVTVIEHRVVDQTEMIGVYNPWGMREEITAEELCRAWDTVRIAGIDCWERAYIPVGPPGSDIGPGRPDGARGVNMLAYGIASIVNGLLHLLRDRDAGGLKEMALGVPRSLSGALVFFRERLR